ncbi:MAG TPA: hypothetical protein VK995_06850, partial [Oceanipulchritudo sp.]|nr:hypothetical protein [Oceanipulchritudo sp.]
GTRARLQARLIDQPTYGGNFLNVLEVLAVEVAEGLYDPQRGYVADDFAPVGRLTGSGYCRSKDRFNIDRPV